MAREPEARKTASVFDFLYVDHKRIGLYLSQFSDFGNLTRLVHSRSVDDATGLTGSIAGVIGGESTRSQQSGIERHYDTQWSQVLNFLDEAQARQMLHRGLPNASIGGLLLVSGALHIVSLRPFERTFGVISDTPATSGNRRQRRAAASHSQTGSAPNDNIGLRVLGSLEQPVFMVLNAGADRLWSTLDPNLMSPTRSPRLTRSPCFLVKTILRASRPAICLKMTFCPSSPMTVAMFCSFSSAEIAPMALRNLPRRYSTSVRTPEIGERFT